MDIITHCRVPRYLHNDLPLGNPLGIPFDHAAQKASVVDALELASTASEPTVIESSLSWPGDPDWKLVYGRVTEENREELLAMGEENRRKRAENNAKGLRR